MRIACPFFLQKADYTCEGGREESRGPGFEESSDRKRGPEPRRWMMSRRKTPKPGVSGTARVAAVGDCGRLGDGYFWRSPGDAIGDSRRAGGEFSLWIQARGAVKPPNFLSNQALGRLSETPLRHPLRGSLSCCPSCPLRSSGHRSPGRSDHCGPNRCPHCHLGCSPDCFVRYSLRCSARCPAHCSDCCGLSC